MTWPAPRPGLVIRYSYLWSRESAAGREEGGAKDRPCAIVLAVKQDGEGRIYVLPVTHSAPSNPDDAVELPPAIKTRLNLDDQRFWIVVTETNSFLWPGPDLRFVPGQGPDSAAMGYLPPGLFRLVRDRFLANARRGKIAVTKRTE